MQTAVFERRIKINERSQRSPAQDFDLHLNEYGVMGRISDISLAYFIAPALRSIDLSKNQGFRIRHCYCVVGSLAFQFGKALAVGNDQLQNTSVGAVDRRVID